MELTVKQALIYYGLGGITAIGGFYNRAILMMGMAVLIFISIMLTLFGE